MHVCVCAFVAPALGSCLFPGVNNHDGGGESSIYQSRDGGYSPGFVSF